MSKRFSLFVPVVIFTFLMFTSCAEVVSKEAVQLEVKVTDLRHSPRWVQIVNMGKIMSAIHHPETFNVHLLIENKIYKYDNSKMYYYCEGKIGETLKAEFVKVEYDDNTTRYEFIRFID